MFGFGRKARSEHAGHGGMEHGQHAQVNMGAQGESHSGNITVLKVEGMTCMHCKMSVERALNSVEGVESANVDLMRKEAVVIGSAAKDVLAQAVEEAGYSVVN
ncbi:CopZ family metallochaperone [Paradesulfitobacterium ferrireducens]|uniref:CopZ family metallochaperone n=1 Tax=Paradesulfitobacterium ferrireducens TaxID=2816476 RepID=UPI002E2D1CE8|nr:heavy metal-associated domain-containing protein [Paradesulfitobacterium ferrireducens]